MVTFNLVPREDCDFTASDKRKWRNKAGLWMKMIRKWDAFYLKLFDFILNCL